MKKDDFEEDFEDDYHEKVEEDFEDDDEESEEGFMKGYEKESNSIRCANCKSLIENESVEEEFSGFVYKFCCQECLKEFEKKQK